MIEQQLLSLYTTMHGRHRDHTWDFGSMSCIPLHFSSHGLFGRRLRRWGSTGSWVRKKLKNDSYFTFVFPAKLYVNYQSLFIYYKPVFYF